MRAPATAQKRANDDPVVDPVIMRIAIAIAAIKILRCLQKPASKVTNERTNQRKLHNNNIAQTGFKFYDNQGENFVAIRTSLQREQRLREKRIGCTNSKLSACIDQE